MTNSKETGADTKQIRAFIREQQWGGSVATHYQTFRSVEAMRAFAAKYPQDEIVSFEEVL